MTTTIELIGKTGRTILRKVYFGGLVRIEVTYPDGKSESVIKKTNL